MNEPSRRAPLHSAEVAHRPDRMRQALRRLGAWAKALHDNPLDLIDLLVIDTRDIPPAGAQSSGRHAGQGAGVPSPRPTLSCR